MDRVLHIGDPVVTKEVLQRRHHGETDVHICRRAVITPTGWDYIRDHRLRVTRVEQAALPSGAASGSLLAAGGLPPVGGHTAASRPRAGSGAIQEISPPTADDTSLVQQGRCEFPSRSFGCKTEEFGSGFVEPSTCQECPVQQLQPASPSAVESSCGCGGCNRHRTQQQVAGEGRGAPDLEALVQQITEEIIFRLGSS